jgi:uncharacterized protein (DUF58 family)
MDDSFKFDIQPMTPDEMSIIEKNYKTGMRFLIFFIVFQAVWIGMMVFGYIYSALAVILLGGFLFLLYILATVYYARQNKKLKLDMTERAKVIVKGAVVSKQVKPGRMYKFYFIRINDRNYQVPLWFYEKTEVGSIAEFPASKHAGVVLFQKSQ